MKYAYPQDPTSAISSIRRTDERADATTQQSSLERQQEIAIVGQTVPLIYCHRFDYGGDLGVNGGVWYSPLLIQLGIEQAELSMMYIISQGQVEGLTADNTYWGYQKLNDVDPNAVMCYAYEAVPDCVDLDYVPGGSVAWDTTITGAGPTFNSSTRTYKLTENCRKVTFTFDAQVSVSGTYQTLTGYSGFTTLAYNDFQGKPYHPSGTTGVKTDDNESCRWALWNQTPSSYDNSGGGGGGGISGGEPSGGGNAGDGSSESPTRSGNLLRGSISVPTTYHTYNFAALQTTASYTVTTQVRYDYAVIDLETLLTVKSGQFWIANGVSSLTIEMPPGKYEVRFSNLYAERSTGSLGYIVADPGTNACTWASYWSTARSYANVSPPSGFMAAAPPGVFNQSINSTVTQVIYNELQFPDLPGGGQQLVGGLDDLTLMGIKGDIQVLRPINGPSYFLQSHIFIEDGIKVDRLTLGGHGPSPYYGDLVNYLLDSTEILQAEQIDRDSLITINKMHERYTMFYNGVLQVTTSFVEWLTRTAPYFLAVPRQVNGKYGLSPACPLNSTFELSRDPVSPALVITSDDIVQESYERTYVSAKERRPICLIMVYRDQPVTQVGQTVTIEVRYEGTALSGPFESHDLTDFCCRPEQALLAARYILAKRRYTTHYISFQMGRRGAQLNPGDIVQVELALDTSDGEGVADNFFYQVDSITEGQDGLISVEATHYPVDNAGVSVIAQETHEGVVSVT